MQQIVWMIKNALVKVKIVFSMAGICKVTKTHNGKPDQTFQSHHGFQGRLLAVKLQG